jgi:Transposase
METMTTSNSITKKTAHTFDPSNFTVVPARTFEDLRVGEIFRAPSRTLTDAHASAFQAVLDIAKSVFQVHGVDNDGKVVIRRQLKRRYVLAFFEKLQPCLVGIEACASSHHWSRELQALGHTVRLMPPAYVKPYVKRQKNDAADAEAICEAVTRTICGLCQSRRPSNKAG